MKLRDVFVSKEDRFAIEEDLETGAYYISFPVFNGLTEYSEFYKISKEELDLFLGNVNLLKDFVMNCKNRKMDERLLMKPGKVRGNPC